MIPNATLETIESSFEENDDDNDNDDDDDDVFLFDDDDDDDDPTRTIFKFLLVLPLASYTPFHNVSKKK